MDFVDPCADGHLPSDTPCSFTEFVRHVEVNILRAVFPPEALPHIPPIVVTLGEHDR